MARMKKAIAKAKELGMSSLAITDYGNMYCAFKFYIACKDAGIKPIIGCELYKAANSRKDQQHGDFKDAYSLIVLAKDVTGIETSSELFLQSVRGLTQPRVIQLPKVKKDHTLWVRRFARRLVVQILHEQTTKAQNWS
jgi:DNA polymerase III alpha subunit